MKEYFNLMVLLDQINFQVDKTLRVLNMGEMQFSIKAMEAERLYIQKKMIRSTLL